MALGLNNYQIGVLRSIGERELCNGDEGAPQWWVDGGDAVRGGTAKALYRRGYLFLTRHAGGQPGVDYFRITDLGRAVVAGKTI